jgi:hypothetical protein
MLEFSIWRFEYWFVALILVLVGEDQNENSGQGLLDSSIKEHSKKRISLKIMNYWTKNMTPTFISPYEGERYPSEVNTFPIEEKADLPTLCLAGMGSFHKINFGFYVSPPAGWVGLRETCMASRKSMISEDFNRGSGVRT